MDVFAVFVCLLLLSFLLGLVSLPLLHSRCLHFRFACFTRQSRHSIFFAAAPFNRSKPSPNNKTSALGGQTEQNRQTDRQLGREERRGQSFARASLFLTVSLYVCICVYMFVCMFVTDCRLSPCLVFAILLHTKFIFSHNSMLFPTVPNGVATLTTRVQFCCCCFWTVASLFVLFDCFLFVS